MNLIEEIFKILFEKYGPQYWWPADSSFEVIIGAILTQATNWNNVEKAIANIKNKKLLDPDKLYYISLEKLEDLIRPCGFYKIKARRIKNFLDFLFKSYDGKLDKISKETTFLLREKLLSISGLGKETVDSILLYAFNRPVFVIDNYTRKIFSCLGILEFSLSYEQWQSLFQNFLFPIYQLFNEYHALIVEHGKRKCKLCKGSCFIKERVFSENFQFYYKEYLQLRNKSRFHPAT
ncbi:MAG: endonuclease [Dictyoglomus sp.]|nr:endonuclease [Dictyoglomus sp.]MCX7942026.1 endonuclease [Dictyoglomaceae bacterium]MDW8188712.1 endonuclease [Dictyoglomus sp.]